MGCDKGLETGAFVQLPDDCSTQFIMVERVEFIDEDESIFPEAKTPVVK